MKKQIQKGDKVECISNEFGGVQEFERLITKFITKGWTYEVVNITPDHIWVKSNDGKSRAYAAEWFRLKEKKMLTLKDLFIGKIVIANYSEPAVAWVTGLGVNPIGPEIIVKIKRADDQFGREIAIHPSNLTELE